MSVDIQHCPPLWAGEKHKTRVMGLPVGGESGSPRSPFFFFLQPYVWCQECGSGLNQVPGVGVGEQNHNLDPAGQRLLPFSALCGSWSSSV